MTWEQVLKNLSLNGGIFVGYDASIGIELDSLLGDIPVYRFRADYMTPQGLKSETFSTLKDLQMFVLDNAVFMKCSECNEPICEDFIENEEREEIYCSVNHMAKVMDRVWGANCPTALCGRC